MTEQKAHQFAEEWISAWNSHDLDAILSHYETGAVLTSPVAARILNDPAGVVEGKDELREYFRRGLEMFPDLKFELFDLMYGLHSVVLCYRNQRGTKTAEFMEFGDGGKVTRVVANYSS